MNINLTPANWDTFKGATVTLVTEKATFTGTLISLNSKGWNIKEDITGRVITRTASVVTEISTVEDDTFEDADLNFEELDLDMQDEDLEVEDDADDMPEGDGHTTAELAAMFETSARALRVQLRKLGLGVGKGHRYNLTDEELTTVREALNA